MAYTKAFIDQINKDTVTNFVTGILVRFTGTAGEAVHKSLKSIGFGTPAEEADAARRWAHNDVIPGLNNRIAVAAAPGLAVNQELLPPAAPPAPTPEQVWQQKAGTLRMLQETKQAVTGNGGTVNAAFTTTIEALADDVAATFQAGFES